MTCFSACYRFDQIFKITLSGSKLVAVGEIWGTNITFGSTTLINNGTKIELLWVSPNSTDGTRDDMNINLSDQCCCLGQG